VEVEFVAIAGDDAGGFLAAMLEGVESEVSEVGRFGMAEDAEDATMVVEVIVENLLNATQVFDLIRRTRFQME